jgi:hypothetical protein
LTQTGIQNIGVIGELIERQTIKFDYQFYQKDFDADVSCMIMTGGKSLLPSGNLYNYFFWENN